SACAALPCRNSNPGRPASPQTRVSMRAPSTSWKRRSGASASISWNQAGAGGVVPPSAASGGPISGAVMRYAPLAPVRGLELGHLHEALAAAVDRHGLA